MVAPCTKSSSQTEEDNPVNASRGRSGIASVETRRSVRDLKRAVHAGTRPGVTHEKGQIARESALSLLKRSIAFGHHRLAVIRYSIAISVGADVPREDFDYCCDVANASRDPAMLELFSDAASRASNRSGVTSTMP